MTSPLQKEIRLEMTATRGNTAGLSSVSNKLAAIERQIKRIQTLGKLPITLTFAGATGLPGAGGGAAGSAASAANLSKGAAALAKTAKAAQLTREALRKLRTEGFTPVVVSEKRLGAAAQSANIQLRHLDGRIATINTKSGQATVQVKKLAAATEQLNRAAAKQEAALATQRAGVRRGAAAISGAGEVTAERQRAGIRRGAGAITGAGSEVSTNRRIQDSLKRLAVGGFQPVRREVKLLQNGTRQIIQTFQAADGRTATLNKTLGTMRMTTQRSAVDMQKMGDTLSSITAKVFQWTVATTIIFSTLRAVKAFKEEMVAVDFQAGRLTRVFAGMGVELEELKQGAIELGANLGIVPSQAIETVVSIARLQKDRVRTLELLRVALLAQSVAELTVEESIRFTTSAILQFNMSAFEAIHVLNEWNELSNRNKVLTRDLGDAVSVAGAAFFEAGANIQLLNAYTTALAEATGQSGKAIGTALKTIAVYTFRVKTVGVVSKAAGIEIEDAFQNFLPLGEIIARVAAQFDNLTDAERRNVSQAIAGVRRRNQLLVLLRNYPEAIKALQTQFEQENSALKEQAVVARTLQFQISQLKAEFLKLGVSVGDAGFSSILRNATTAGKLFFQLINTGHPITQLLLIGLQGLIIQFVTLRIASFATNGAIKTTGTLMVALTAKVKALTVSMATLKAVGRSLLSASIIGIAFVGLSIALEKLLATFSKFGVPSPVEGRLKAIQDAAIEFNRLDSATKNVKDLLGALEEFAKIEAAGGTLTTQQKELRDAAIDYIDAVDGSAAAHEVVIQLLDTQIGRQWILQRMIDRRGEAEQELAKTTKERLADSSKAIAEQRAEIDRLAESLVRIREQIADPELGVSGATARGLGLLISEDLIISRIKREEEAFHNLGLAHRLLQEEMVRNEAKRVSKTRELSDAEIEERKKAFQDPLREQLRQQEKTLGRQSAFDAAIEVTEVNKISVSIKALTKHYDGLKRLRDEIQETTTLSPEEIVAVEELDSALRSLGTRIDNLTAKRRLAARTKLVRDEIEDLKRSFDFKSESLAIISEDQLEKARRQYAHIGTEIVRIKNELANAHQLQLSAEQVAARQSRLQELEKQTLTAANNIRLEQLKIQVDITREMQKQNEQAEKSFLFADRETQARARGLAGELQRRGGQRLSLDDFLALSQNVRQIIRDMVPGLLPVEALSREQQTAAAAAASGTAQRNQVFPFGAQPQPLDRAVTFVPPPSQLPSIAQDPAFFDRFDSAIDRFSASQEKMANQISQSVAEAKRNQFELDVDIDFGGVSGPLNNLVTRVGTIVEQRVEEQLSELEQRLTDSLKGPQKQVRPNVGGI